ncbi:MAG: glycosyltransferase [Oscillospiraceae bacterium]
MEKEKNFISAVAYMHNDSGRVAPFLTRITNELNKRFDTYEIILVNDACKDASVAQAKAFAASCEIKSPITIVNMSIYQGLELCMNAGLDLAIGDFVYEFDTMSLCYECEKLSEAYNKSLDGNDIVSVSPSKSRNSASSLFYKLFNITSHSKYKLHTDIFRVLSRRAINRVHSITANMPYRKAAYAASGLSMATIYTSKEQTDGEPAPRFSLAVNSLALYTDAAYRLSLGISFAMLTAAVLEIIYTVCIYFGGTKPIEGWTTTMMVLSFGFFGIFLVLALVIKYLSLLVDLIFKKQKYLVEGIEKI